MWKWGGVTSCDWPLGETQRTRGPWRTMEQWGFVLDGENGVGTGQKAGATRQGQQEEAGKSKAKGSCSGR